MNNITTILRTLSFRACRGILFSFLLPVSLSCEKYVDFPADEDGRIHISAMLGTGEQDKIDVTVSQPAMGNETVTAEAVRLYLEADGTPVALTMGEQQTDGTVSYDLEGTFAPGQKIVLRAEAEGLPSVKAVTTVPRSLPQVRIEPRIVESYRDRDDAQNMADLYPVRNFHIVLDEKPQDNSYFAVQILRKTVYDIIGTPSDYMLEQYLSKSGIVKYDDLYSNTSLTEGGAISSMEKELLLDYSGGEMLVAPAEDEDGKSVLDLYVAVTERRLVSASYTNTGGEQLINYEIYEDFEYDLKVYRLSPELYHCMRARYIVEESDAPIHLGFTPVTYTYTNVVGGLGMFGAVSMYETDWFRIN